MSDFKVELPFGAPPILPDVTKQLRDYIVKPDNLPIHNFENSQQHFPRRSNPSALYHYNLSSALTTLKVNRDLATGKLTDFKEVLINGSQLPESQSSVVNEDINKTLLADDLGDEFLKEDWQTVPPWFLRGYDFEQDSNKIEDSRPTHNEAALENEENSHIVNLATILQKEQEILNLWKESSFTETEKPKESSQTINIQLCNDDADVLKDTPEEISFTSPVIRISDVSLKRKNQVSQWAEEIDVSQPVMDFHQRVPDMAYKYDFELDTFQKQAILMLEKNCSVLVSAHTSAGKTVVAEYAIALSQKHMTRVIYTSPIKALSNQKYRDFKKTFKDVGLITGDFQVNQTATCLIMTTEILRSMLLAQNEIIRDLEFVIFDEVHYINDLDRGHVWEEVFIFLPPQVCIVMLSATIPNAFDFAEWVGRTKQRKIYVISTLQRPVPLEHFLYTGTGGSSKDERFLILNSRNQFQKEGYRKAVQAKTSKTSKKEGARGSNLNVKQEKTMWVALLEHLQNKDKLPVVAFTLSRKRCDQNAESLLSLDLTTAKEKSHILHFFQQSIQRLKEPDQRLPQIIKMQQLLEAGIGVHHSGILPILKEIVEMLFQEKCVKVLFATETFAMGVNMPAKTVVFDSIQKWDGQTFRLLKPSEYIQMAGRAGRRGLDKTGTVIIVCKGDMPSEQDLTSMMIGIPVKIDSKFRLTYSIILKLERKRVAAEGKVTVEELMANSFKEVNHIKKKASYAVNLTQVEKELINLSDAVNKSISYEQLANICTTCLAYLDVWKKISPKLFTDKQAFKVLQPGRVVLLTYKHHVNKLAILLNVDYKREAVFKVLVLSDTEEIAENTIVMKEEKTKKVNEIEEEWYKVLALMKQDSIFVANNIGGHDVLLVNYWDILEVTTISVKIDAKIILGDWDNRQIPRFRNSPPGKTFQKALEELTEITHNIKMLNNKLEYINLLKDMLITTDEQLCDMNQLKLFKEKIRSFKTDNIVNFDQQLYEIFQVKFLEQKKQNLEYLMSYKSLSLYEDYQNRLAVLRELKYVDAKNSVQMKGNVACEMSNHELLITELVLRNALNELQPSEIAALLSSFVYQGQRRDGESEEFELPDSVKQGIETIKEVAGEVLKAEKEHGVAQNEMSGNLENLNFDLVPVVLEWARDKPFADIMQLTDIQEGIIVRCIQQLNETLRDVKDAARIIGEPTLHQKMEEASTAIKRDIVFAASLYMQ